MKYILEREDFLLNENFSSYNNFVNFFKANFLTHPNKNLSVMSYLTKPSDRDFFKSLIKKVPEIETDYYIEYDYRGFSHIIPKIPKKPPLDKKLQIKPKLDINNNVIIKDNYYNKLISLGKFNTLEYATLKYMFKKPKNNTVEQKKKFNTFFETYYKNNLLKTKFNTLKKAIYLTNDYSLIFDCCPGNIITIYLTDMLDKFGNYNKNKNISKTPFYLCTLDDLNYLKNFLDNIIKTI